MYDTMKMTEHVCRELEKKAETGLKSTQDLDTVWKLVDVYKNLLKIDMLQEAEGYSERRHRDSMGRYAREYERGSSYDRGRDAYGEAKDEYMSAKNSYRSTRSPESKREMTATLSECMAGLRDDLRDMLSNADTREERDRIKDMLREIGSMAN
nr:MAG TPA: hypothetical protein [Caudoviricetes sp.]